MVIRRIAYVISLSAAVLLMLYIDVQLGLAAAVGIIGGEGVTDWVAFYSAGTIVRLGDGVDLYDIAVQDAMQQQLFPAGNLEFVFVMPAFVAIVLAPLTVLSFGQSYLVWFGINLSIVVLLTLVARRHLSHVTADQRNAFLWCAVVSIPTTMVVLQGQFDLLLLGALLLSYGLLTRGHETLAGAVLAIGLVKPHLIVAPIVMLLINRRYCAVVWFALIGALVILVPPLLLGPGFMLDQFDLYRSYITSSTGHAVNTAVMINLRGTVVSITGESNPLLWALLLIGVGGTAWMIALKIWLSRSVTSAQSWAIALCLPLIYSPHVHIQSGVLLLGAAALFIGASGNGSTSLRYTRIIFAFVMLTVLWLWSLVGVSLVALLVVAAYLGLAFRWPEARDDAGAGEVRPQRSTSREGGVFTSELDQGSTSCAM